MKVVILVGGFGTRISEETKKSKTNKKEYEPIVLHIIKHFMHYDLKEFIILSGYKHKLLQNYFRKYKNLSANIKVVIGLRSNTGERIIEIRHLIKEDEFLLTYGDGISNINIKELIKFYFRRKRKIHALMTVVRPQARLERLKF